METKDKKKSIIIVLTIIGILVIILFCVFRVVYFNTDDGQKDLLIGECANAMDTNRSSINMSIVTKGEFAIIERAYKEYASEIMPYIKEIADTGNVTYTSKIQVKDDANSFISITNEMNKIWNGKNYWANTIDYMELSNKKAKEAYLALKYVDEYLKENILNTRTWVNQFKNHLN